MKFATYVCVIAMTHAGSVSSQEVGDESGLDLTARELSTSFFTVLGKRRIGLSSSYSASSQQTVITNTAVREWSTSLSYIHPVNDQAELNFTVPVLYSDFELGADDVQLEADSKFGISDVSIGGRYNVWAESDGRPEVTALASLNVPVDAGIQDAKWGGSVGASFVTSSYPAYLFGSSALQFDEDNLSLGYSLGLALGINDQLNASVSLGGTVGEATLPGTLGETTVFMQHVTYVLDQYWTIDGSVGIGLTDESPDRVLSLGLGYRF